MRNSLVLIPAVLLAFGLAPLPYGYYTFLRLVVTLSAIVLASQEFRQRDGANGWVVSFGLMAILFNPVIPVHLSRELWAVLDLAAATLFAAKWYVGVRED